MNPRRAAARWVMGQNPISARRNSGLLISTWLSVSDHSHARHIGRRSAEAKWALLKPDHRNFTCARRCASLEMTDAGIADDGGGLGAYHIAGPVDRLDAEHARRSDQALFWEQLRRLVDLSMSYRYGIAARRVVEAARE